MKSSLYYTDVNKTARQWVICCTIGICLVGCTTHRYTHHELGIVAYYRIPLVRVPGTDQVVWDPEGKGRLPYRILQDKGIPASGISNAGCADVRVSPDQFDRAREILREAIKTHQLDGLEIGVVEDDSK